MNRYGKGMIAAALLAWWLLPQAAPAAPLGCDSLPVACFNYNTGFPGLWIVSTGPAPPGVVAGEDHSSLDAGGGTSVSGVYGRSFNFTGVHGLSGDYAGVWGENSGAGPGVRGTSANGIGGLFAISNAANSKAALQAATAGTGPGGVFQITNAANSQYAVKATTNGSGFAGFFQTGAANNSAAVRAQTTGGGWAAQFLGLETTSKGVYIKTNGGTGLQVVGGTKSAVVPTSQGPRALYAEEASEVYFTDYGFGKLSRGKAVIPIEPLFAETVNLEQPYHVFLQVRGNAELYVGRCTPKDFEVCLRGGEADVEFSYRLVGKRRGFEQARLEPAPGSDQEPVAAANSTEKLAAAR